MRRDMSDITTEIYNNLHRQATIKSLKDKEVAQARYEGYEEALCDYVRMLDAELEQEEEHEETEDK